MKHGSGRHLSVLSPKSLFLFSEGSPSGSSNGVTAVLKITESIVNGLTINERVKELLLRDGRPWVSVSSSSSSVTIEKDCGGGREAFSRLMTEEESRLMLNKVSARRGG